MASLEVRILIRADPERIWPILADFDAQAGWMADVRRLQVTSDIGQGVGTTLEVTSELFGLPVVRDRMEVDSWQPPLRYTVVHTGQFSGTGEFRLDRVEGGTIMVWREDFLPPLGPVGELAFKLFLGPYLRRVFGRSLDNLREVAEADSASKPSPSA